MKKPKHTKLTSLLESNPKGVLEAFEKVGQQAMKNEKEGVYYSPSNPKSLISLLNKELKKLYDK